VDAIVTSEPGSARMISRLSLERKAPNDVCPKSLIETVFPKNWNCVLAGSSTIVVISPVRLTRAITSQKLSPSSAERDALKAMSPASLIDAHVKLRGL
jgi:hypothetical protein